MQQITYDDIIRLTESETRDIFLRDHPGVISKNEFSKQYRINTSNFNKFLAGRKPSPLSVAAIKQWIIDRNNIPTPGDVRLLNPIDEKHSRSHLPTKTVTINELFPLLKHHFQLHTDTPGVVKLIDADNSCGALQTVTPGEFAIAVIIKNKGSKNLIGREFQDNVAILRSITDAKEAVDHLLTIITIKLDVFMAILGRECKFIIYSKDLFASELIEQMKLINPGRSIEHIISLR